MALCTGRGERRFVSAARLGQRLEGERGIMDAIIHASGEFACKRGIPFVAEAMEVLGGMGVRRGELPRLYREKCRWSSIWEGSAISCLDVLRGADKTTHGVYDVLNEALRKSRSGSPLRPRYVGYSVYANRTKQWAEIAQQLFLLGCRSGNAASCLAAAGAAWSDDAGYTRRNAAVCRVRKMIYC